MKKTAEFWIFILVIGLLFLSGCGRKDAKEQADAEKKTIRIIETSDTHGKFVPWDYALNEEDPSGSMAQVATAVREYRNDNTLLIDAGDTIQDNSADLFLESGDVHPMIRAINEIGYDAWVTGNHEYNYGMDVVRKTVNDVKCEALCGNVWDENGDPVADSYHIFDVDGVRVAVIGMVTGNITAWDKVNLEKCTVKDPLDETRKIIKKIEGQYDVLVGAFHMGFENELGLKNSGVTDILNACPEFDVMLSAHEHQAVGGKDVNGVLVVQNSEMAKTMAVIDLTLEKDGDGWKAVDKSSKCVEMSDYEPDPELVKKLSKYDKMARENAEQEIGRLEGGDLAPAYDGKGVPKARTEDTALIDLILSAMLHYSGAEAAGAALFVDDANMTSGTILKCDTAKIYKFSNTIYTLRMTGAQLKKYMEWCAGYFNTVKKGDQEVTANPEVEGFNYDMFGGVNYEINVSKEPGERIENLAWPDGTPVADDDTFEIAVNNYRANSHLLTPGVIYDEDDMPELIAMDVRSDLGGIREIIGHYITDVKGGVITPECDHNWKLTGID